LVPKWSGHGDRGNRHLVTGCRGHHVGLRLNHGNDERASRVPAGDLSDGLSGMAERVGAADDGRDLAGFNESLQGDQVGSVLGLD
jgi:hypothetical protein